MHAVQVLAVLQDPLQQRGVMLAAQGLDPEAGAAACAAAGAARSAVRRCTSAQRAAAGEDQPGGRLAGAAVSASSAVDIGLEMHAASPT